MFYHPVPPLIRRTYRQDSPTYQAAKSPRRKMKARLWPQRPSPLDRFLYSRG